jgi:hypothetical protein
MGKTQNGLGVAVQYSFRDNECNLLIAQGWCNWKYKKAKSIERNCASWGAFPKYRVENGAGVYGNFNYAGLTKERVLVW